MSSSISTYVIQGITCKISNMAVKFIHGDGNPHFVCCYLMFYAFKANINLDVGSLGKHIQRLINLKYLFISLQQFYSKSNKPLSV